MTNPSPPTSASGAPRWRTLAALGAAVLLLHLWGLGIEGVHIGEGSAAAVGVAVADPAPHQDAGLHAGAGQPDAPPRAPSVQVTQARWIQAAAEPPPVVARPRKAPPAAPPLLEQAPLPETPPAAPPLMEQAPWSEAPADAPITEAPPLAPAPEVLETVAAGPAVQANEGTTAPPVQLPPSEPPTSTRLAYDIDGVIKGLNYRATGVLDWTLSDQRYTARMEMSMFLVGTRVQTSEGGMGPEGLRPERFSDKRRSEVATHFDRSEGRIRFSSNAPEAPLMPGAQDRLSLFMQIAGRLRATPAGSGDVIEFQVAGTGDAEVWRFEVGELQTIDLPAGAVEARWVRRLPRKPHDSTVEVWLAPSMNHLPVRLLITQANGDVADQRLARLP